MRKIKTGDTVVVITGKYKKKQGNVLRVIEGGKRLIVEGINLVKKTYETKSSKGATWWHY